MYLYLYLCYICICVIQSTMRRSVVLNVEPDPSAERVQDSVGRKDNGVEQHVLNANIYKGDLSETQTSSILNKSKAYIQF